MTEIEILEESIKSIKVLISKLDVESLGAKKATINQSNILKEYLIAEIMAIHEQISILSNGQAND